MARPTWVSPIQVAGTSKPATTHLTNTKLKIFVGGNAKLPIDTASFSLPSGFTCPGALTCLSQADRDTGRITDGPGIDFRCFSASQESGFPTLRRARWHNFDLLRKAKTREKMRALILEALPPDRKWNRIRVHVAGDFYSLDYLKAWLDVMTIRNDKEAYAYTKSAHHLKALRDEGFIFPDNFKFVLSWGGKFDQLYDDLALKTAKVIFHPDDANGLAIDHDDSHASNPEEDFALLLHNTQPANSEAGAATKRMRQEAIQHTYTRA